MQPHRELTTSAPTLEYESAFPPSDFSRLLLASSRCRISERHKRGLQNREIAELGAKEGFVGISLSTSNTRLTFTDILERRLALIQRNVASAGLVESQVVGSSEGEWFPMEVDWQSIDVIVVNPPSIPCPPGFEVGRLPDEHVFYAGKDGRRELSRIIERLPDVLGPESELLLTGADYVLDSWIEQFCFEKRLIATQVLRKRLFSGLNGIDWEIRGHIKKELGWGKFEETSSGLFFEAVAYTVRKLDQ
ncbi:MAG: hypothetical protein AAFX06_16655 [Planctomycetota bacterium]